MPQVRIKGIDEKTVLAISERVTEEICRITDCPKEYVEIELVYSKVVKDNKLVMPKPFIEIYWFKRTDDQTDQVARAITEIVKAAGIQSIDIAFILYEKHLYYEDGEHF